MSGHADGAAPVDADASAAGAGGGVAGTLAPVTIERIAAWFDRQGYIYERSGTHSGAGQAVRTRFVGCPYAVALIGGRVMEIHASFRTDLPDGPTSAASLRALVGDLNRSRVIPTLSTFVDDDGLQLAAAMVVPVGAGLDEVQLDDALTTGLDAVLSGFDELAQALGVEPPGES